MNFTVDNSTYDIPNFIVEEINNLHTQYAYEANLKPIKTWRKQIIGQNGPK